LLELVAEKIEKPKEGKKKLNRKPKEAKNRRI